MLIGIDHLVIAVRDPDAAAAALEADLGLAVTGGGRHEGRGTFNRLAFLGDAYLELIGVYDRAMVETTTSFPVGSAALALLDEGQAAVGEHHIRLASAAEESLPVVDLTGEPGSPSFDLVRFGIRWVARA